MKRYGTSVLPRQRRPRPPAVVADVGRGCRPTWASVRCHRLCPWGSTMLRMRASTEVEVRVRHEVKIDDV